MALVSQAFLGGEAGAEPAVALTDLAAASDGLICLAGGAAGPVGRLLAQSQSEAAGAALLALKDVFSERLYIELQRHGPPEEARCGTRLRRLPYSHHLPPLPPHPAH